MYQFIELDLLALDIARSGFTQKEISERAEINQSNVSRFLNGERNLSYFSFVRLVKAFDGDPRDYLNEEGKKTFVLELKE